MENYESLGVIGEGTYGVVMRARHRETGQVVAIKKFKESDEDEQVRKTSLREVRVLKQLRHDNIISLLEVFRRKGKLYLVFEYVERTILEVLEGRPNGLDENDVRRYTYQLLRGVEYCHAHNVMHRDIKPENILISKNGTLKLCDFGFARTLSVGGKYTDYVATRWYRGPELLVGDVEYTKGVDIWAVGCIFAEVSNGMPLFPGESDVDQLAHIMRCFGRLTTRQVQTFRRNPLYVGVELPAPKDQEPLDARFPTVPRPWLQFLKCCLKPDPEQRESCTALMNLPYFTDNGFRSEFEQELQLLFEKEQRMLQSIGRASTNKSAGSTQLPPSQPSRSGQSPTPASSTQHPDAPMVIPGRSDSPAVVTPPAINGAKPMVAQTAAKPPPPSIPSIGSLWSQYLASTAAPPAHHSGEQLPDLGQRVHTLQTQHPLFAGGYANSNATGLYYRGDGAGGPIDPLKGPGLHNTSGVTGSHYPSQQTSLAMTSTSVTTKGYHPPQSSQQVSRPVMFPSLGSSSNASAPGVGGALAQQTPATSSPSVANASLGLSYKKKPVKKNVLSTLNIGGGAYGAPANGALPAGGLAGANPYSFSSGMVLQGHHTGTTAPMPPQSQQGHRRTSKPWMQ
jgi:cyclin-dependent kinase-like